MNIKVTSLCIGDIYQKTTVRKEFRPGKFGTDVTSVPYKENALLIKVGNGYVDIDTIKDEKTLKRDEYVNVSSGDRSNWIDIITYASIAEQRAKEIGEIATAINTNTNQLNMDVESITARCSAIESTIRSIRDKIQMMYDITE